MRLSVSSVIESSFSHEDPLQHSLDILLSLKRNIEIWKSMAHQEAIDISKEEEKILYLYASAPNFILVSNSRTGEKKHVSEIETPRPSLTLAERVAELRNSLKFEYKITNEVTLSHQVKMLNLYHNEIVAKVTCTKIHRLGDEIIARFNTCEASIKEVQCKKLVYLSKLGQRDMRSLFCRNPWEYSRLCQELIQRAEEEKVKSYNGPVNQSVTSI